MSFHRPKHSHRETAETAKPPARQYFPFRFSVHTSLPPQCKRPPSFASKRDDNSSSLLLSTLCLERPRRISLSSIFPQLQ